MKKSEYVRLIVVLSVIFLLYLALIVRLFYWQVVRADELKKISRAQSTETIQIPAIRGEILASDGFPLASNTISYELYSNPKVIPDKNDYAEKLSKILNDDPASISAKLNQDLYWVVLGRNLSGDQKKAVENLNLVGLGFEQQYDRFYPEASMAAHLIGFVGKDNNGEDKGYFGVEGEYNNQLSGRSGDLYAVKDALGNQILGDVRQDPKIDGRSVKLTIDRTVQFIVNQRLSEGMKKYGAESGSAIAMDTKTGAILAMSSFPRFDPTKYYDYDTSFYPNPVLSSLYEPGSTFKTIVMASAIDKNLVTPQTKCDICAGPVPIGEYQIRTWDNKYFPNITMEEVIVHSDNTGMTFVGRKLGIDGLVSSLKKFGIGQPTGIDLQGETTGVLRDESDWALVDLATASFGQGISITPMQLITAVNSIANDGVLMKPYLVSEIETPDGAKIKINPTEKNRTVSMAAAKTVTSMMVDAVENGEAKWTKIKNYRIAGKTGTAQIPVAGHYDPNQTVASFIGFFPADDPKVTILVLYNKPQTSIYGAETAAPTFFGIARDLIKYYDLPPM